MQFRPEFCNYLDGFCPWFIARLSFVDILGILPVSGWSDLVVIDTLSKKPCPPLLPLPRQAAHLIAIQPYQCFAILLHLLLECLFAFENDHLSIIGISITSILFEGLVVRTVPSVGIIESRICRQGYGVFTLEGRRKLLASVVGNEQTGTFLVANVLIFVSSYTKRVDPFQF